jgi:5-methylcytosine-specific restriction endonuclease McrA
MCDFHARQYERERSRRRREKTKGVYKRKNWAMRRKQAFERDPFCAWRFEDGTRCQRLGEELDHIVPLDAGGDAYAASNLQLLCAEHHRQKTARENRERVISPPQIGHANLWTTDGVAPG